MTVKLLICITVIGEAALSVLEFDDGVIEIQKIIVLNFFLLLELCQISFFKFVEIDD